METQVVLTDEQFEGTSKVAPCSSLMSSLQGTSSTSAIPNSPIQIEFYGR